jgi:purine-binding chemotaxis protein CheW
MLENWGIRSLEYVVTGSHERQPEERVISAASLILFSLHGQRYALRLDAVERVVRAAAITPLPKAPEIVLGILDLQGEIIPVIDLRKRFRLPDRALLPEDQFLIARARSLRVALVMDETVGIMEEPEPGPMPPAGMLSGTEYVAGVVRTDDGLVIIHDLDTFLSLEEEASLVDALERDRG